MARQEVREVQKGQELDLAGYTAVVTEVRLHASWASEEDISSGAPARRASVQYRVAVRNDGDAPAPATDDLELRVRDDDALEASSERCEADNEADPPEASALPPGQTVSLQRCADLPPIDNGQFTIYLENQSVADSPIYYLRGVTPIESLRQNGTGS